MQSTQRRPMPGVENTGNTTSTPTQTSTVEISERGATVGTWVVCVQMTVGIIVPIGSILMHVTVRMSCPSSTVLATGILYGAVLISTATFNLFSKKISFGACLYLILSILASVGSATGIVVAFSCVFTLSGYELAITILLALVYLAGLVTSIVGASFSCKGCCGSVTNVTHYHYHGSQTGLSLDHTTGLSGDYEITVGGHVVQRQTEVYYSTPNDTVCINSQADGYFTVVEDQETPKYLTISD